MSAIAVGAVVLAAGVFIAGVGIGHGGSSEAALPSGATNPAPISYPVEAVQASTCGLPGLDPAGTTLTAAPATVWTTVGTMAAPSAKGVGPGRTSGDGLRFCYAHTAAGALFAVANLWAMGTDSRLTVPVLQQQTVPGPGRTAALAAGTPQANTGLSAQIAGFKVTSYTGRAATVDIAFQLNTGQLVSFPAPVQWDGGDWKAVLADDGTPVFRPSTLLGLAGYVPWAGAA